jgi:hypothetical protein
MGVYTGAVSTSEEGRTSSRIFGKTIKLKVMKRTLKSSVRIQKMSVKTYCNTECQNILQHRVTARDVAALAILGIYASTDQKRRMIVINLDQLAPCEGVAWNEQP